MWGSYRDIHEALDSNPNGKRLDRFHGRPLTEDILKDILYTAEHKPMIRSMKREMARQKRYGARFAVAVLEVKELLDGRRWRHALTHGEFENKLARVMRESEAFFAFQDGHFFLLLIDVDTKLTEVAIKRIVAQMGNKYHIEYGFGVYPEHGQEVVDLIKMAWNGLSHSLTNDLYYH